MSGQADPVGVVLAGGLGRRIGGSKAIVELSRRPLISYPLHAVWQALGNVAIAAKPDTELPSLPGAVVWVEPQEPRHPLAGIIHAIGMAAGRPVLVCASDMPLVTSEVIGAVARADPGAAPAVVASWEGQIHPLLARYQPSALSLLTAAAADPEIPLREAIAGLGPVRYELENPDCLFNVNTPDDLLQAAAMLDLRHYT